MRSSQNHCWHDPSLPLLPDALLVLMVSLVGLPLWWFTSTQYNRRTGLGSMGCAIKSINVQFSTETARAV